MGINRTHFTRRDWLLTSALGAGTLLNWPDSYLRAAAEDKSPPIRAITRGPKFHWFGYYDKLQFDPTSRFALGMQVDFEHRAPTPDDEIRIGMIDLADGDRWQELATTRAWCWQQGCMLQWLPGSPEEILWNDRDSGRFVTRILNVKSGKQRTIPQPTYCVSPDGKTALSPDFRRLHATRPGYGYAGIPDPHAEELAPREAGIWKTDLTAGKSELIFSFAQLAELGSAADEMKSARHWFNHLLFSPDGSRFIFLHRWRPAGEKTGFKTRLYTAKPDGTDLYPLDPSGQASHFIWRDPESILVWTQPVGQKAGFWLFRDRTAERELIGEGVMTVNGHQTYLPGNAWILNDTYPDRERLQHPYLYHVATKRKVPLGRFSSPAAYQGEWRCDTHPRFSPNGRRVCIDSPHAGGRQLYLIDIGSIVEG